MPKCNAYRASTMLRVQPGRRGCPSLTFKGGQQTWRAEMRSIQWYRSRIKLTMPLPVLMQKWMNCTSWNSGNINFTPLCCRSSVISSYLSYVFFSRVAKCILTEELKILLHDKKLAELDRSERQEESLMYVWVQRKQLCVLVTSYLAFSSELGTAFDHKCQSEQQLSEGRRALSEMKGRLLQVLLAVFKIRVGFLFYTGPLGNGRNRSLCPKWKTYFIWSSEAAMRAGQACICRFTLHFQILRFGQISCGNITYHFTLGGRSNRYSIQGRQEVSPGNMSHSRLFVC